MRCMNKATLVTGGSRGIGKGICLQMAAEGAKVAVNYLDNPEQADEVVRLIQKMGGEAFAVQADVSRKEEVDRMIEQVVKRFGQIDVLVNNAGICPFAEVLEITEELWDVTNAINLKGTFLCSQGAAKKMVENKNRGSIISISSINHYVGGKLQAHYGVTKSGQVNLMKSFALGLAPYGIRCNSVLPGTIETDINKDFLASKENYDYLVGRNPVGFLGAPSDIAHAVVYLASDEARYVNGTELLVDGGALINYL